MDFPKTIASDITEAPVRSFTPNGPVTPAADPTIAVQEKIEASQVKIPLAKLVEEEPESRSINFKNPTFLQEHIEAPTSKTPPASAPSPGNPYDGKSTEQLRYQMVNEEMQPVDEMAPEDFEMIAGFLIDMWDLGTVTLFRMYAMDTTDAPYEMTTSKKSKLKKLLTLILIRFNKKFPLGVLFFMTLALTHITPAMKAHAHRKEMQAAKPKGKRGPKPKAEKKPPAQSPKAKVPADAAAAAAASDSDGPGISAPTVAPKKKQGGQGK